MKVHFKNVNQGDTIILEWDVIPTLKIGIIDCHKDNGNPALEFIKKNSITEIEFIFISHPHYDHYSGIVELLNHCENNNINVKFLGFTFDTAITSYYQSGKSNSSYSKQKALYDFFDILFRQAKKKDKYKFIKRVSQISQTTPSIKTPEYTLHILKPTGFDLVEITSSLSKFCSGIQATKPDFNKYGTIIEISNQNNTCLLTSDAPKKYFNSLKKYYSKNDAVFSLVQIPHHGSIKNHDVSFWENLKKIEKCPALFSVGFENKDQLPDLKVVEDIANLNYDVYSTNAVFGINQFANKNHTPITIPSILGLKSKSIKRSSIDSKYNGDKVFSL